MTDAEGRIGGETGGWRGARRVGVQRTAHAGRRGPLPITGSVLHEELRRTMQLREGQPPPPQAPRVLEYPTFVRRKGMTMHLDFLHAGPAERPERAPEGSDLFSGDMMYRGDSIEMSPSTLAYYLCVAWPRSYLQASAQSVIDFDINRTGTQGAIIRQMATSCTFVMKAMRLLGCGGANTKAGQKASKTLDPGHFRSGEDIVPKMTTVLEAVVKAPKNGERAPALRVDPDSAEPDAWWSESEEVRRVLRSDNIMGFRMHYYVHDPACYPQKAFMDLILMNRFDRCVILNERALEWALRTISTTQRRAGFLRSREDREEEAEDEEEEEEDRRGGEREGGALVDGPEAIDRIMDASPAQRRQAEEAEEVDEGPASNPRKRAYVPTQSELDSSDRMVLARRAEEKTACTLWRNVLTLADFSRMVLRPYRVHAGESSGILRPDQRGVAEGPGRLDDYSDGIYHKPATDLEDMGRFDFFCEGHELHFARTFNFWNSSMIFARAATRSNAEADPQQLNPAHYVPQSDGDAFGVAYPQACWRLEPFVTDPEWLSLRPMPSQCSAVLADIEEMKRRIAAHDAKVAKLRKAKDAAALAALSHCQETPEEAAAIDRGVRINHADALRARAIVRAHERADGPRDPLRDQDLPPEATYAERMAHYLTLDDSFAATSFHRAGSATATASLIDGGARKRGLAAALDPSAQGRVAKADHYAGQLNAAKRQFLEETALARFGLGAEIVSAEMEEQAADGLLVAKDDQEVRKQRLEAEQSKLSGSKILDCFAKIRQQQQARYDEFLGLLARFPLKTEDQSDYTWLPKDPADPRRVLWTFSLEYEYRREMEQAFAVRYRDECLGELSKLLYLDNSALPESHKGQILWREQRGSDNYVAITAPVDLSMTCWANNMCQEALQLEALGEHQNHGEALHLLRSFRITAMSDTNALQSNLVYQGGPATGKSHLMAQLQARSITEAVLPSDYDSNLASMTDRPISYCIELQDEMKPYLLSSYDKLSTAAQAARTRVQTLMTKCQISFQRNVAVANPDGSTSRAVEAVHRSCIRSYLGGTNRCEINYGDAMYDRIEHRILFQTRRTDATLCQRALSAASRPVVDQAAVRLYAMQKRDEHCLGAWVVACQDTGGLPAAGLGLFDIVMDISSRQLGRWCPLARDNVRSMQRARNNARALAINRGLVHRFNSIASPLVEYEPCAPVPHERPDMPPRDQTMKRTLAFDFGGDTQRLLSTCAFAPWDVTIYAASRYLFLWANLDTHDIVLAGATLEAGWNRAYYERAYRRCRVRLPDVEARARERGQTSPEELMAPCSIIAEQKEFERRMVTRLLQRGGLGRPIMALAGRGDHDALSRKQQKQQARILEVAPGAPGQKTLYDPTFVVVEGTLHEVATRFADDVAKELSGADVDSIKRRLEELTKLSWITPLFQVTDDPSPRNLRFRNCDYDPKTDRWSKPQMGCVPIFSAAPSPSGRHYWKIPVDYLMCTAASICFLALTEAENKHTQPRSCILSRTLRGCPMLFHRWEVRRREGHVLEVPDTVGVPESVAAILGGAAALANGGAIAPQNAKPITKAAATGASSRSYVDADPERVEFRRYLDGMAHVPRVMPAGTPLEAPSGLLTGIEHAKRYADMCAHHPDAPMNHEIAFRRALERTVDFAKMSAALVRYPETLRDDYRRRSDVAKAGEAKRDRALKDRLEDWEVERLVEAIRAGQLGQDREELERSLREWHAGRDAMDSDDSPPPSSSSDWVTEFLLVDRYARKSAKRAAAAARYRAAIAGEIGLTPAESREDTMAKWMRAFDGRKAAEAPPPPPPPQSLQQDDSNSSEVFDRLMVQANPAIAHAKPAGGSKARDPVLYDRSLGESGPSSSSSDDGGDRAGSMADTIPMTEFALSKGGKAPVAMGAGSHPRFVIVTDRREKTKP